MQYYENTLTSVELELIEDSLAVQIEHDAVLERLAPQRHSQARSDFAELERSYKAVLERQKVVLTKLVARASETLKQVTRRLRVLEEEYGFIRTHIFWVRDQEPLGLATVQHARTRAEASGEGYAHTGRRIERPQVLGTSLERVPDGCGGCGHPPPGLVSTPPAAPAEDYPGCPQAIFTAIRSRP